MAVDFDLKGTPHGQLAFLDPLGWNVNIESQLIKELLISLIIN